MWSRDGALQVSPVIVPDVVLAMLESGRKVAAYTGAGVWFDIGTVGEHERAVAEIEAHPELFEDA